MHDLSTQISKKLRGRGTQFGMSIPHCIGMGNLVSASLNGTRPLLVGHSFYYFMIARLHGQNRTDKIALNASHDNDNV